MGGLRKLKLLPGLKWSGSLTILASDPRGYTVAFNAVNPTADPRERYVYDHTILTEKQIVEWTGVNPSRRFFTAAAEPKKGKKR